MKRILPAFLLILSIAACGVNVKRDYDPDFNFSQLETYAWESQGRKQAGGELARSALIDQRIRNAVDETLTAKGYRKVTKEKADFAVTYSYTIQDKTEYGGHGGSSVGVGLGTGSRGSFGSIGFSFGMGESDEQGTLIIDMINPATNAQIWRGFARQRLIWPSNPEKSRAKVDATVKAILAKFPPTKS